MAKYEDGSYQCAAAPALIAKVLAGRCLMRYTRASVGEGAIPEGVSPKSLKEPPGYVMEAKIANVTNPVDGECQVTVQINSSDVERGFFAMGIMLYAEDPDEGEVPYTYLRLEDGQEWIRPASSAVGKLATFDLIAAVGAVDRVSASIDPDAIATYSAARQLIAEATVVLDITIPATGWAEAEADEPEGLCKEISIKGLKEDMNPFLNFYPAYQDTVRSCGMSTSVRTTNGALRVFAQEKPNTEVRAVLTLLCASVKNPSAAAAGGQDASYVLPAATATRLGGVKVGDGLSVTPDGRLSVNPEKVMTAEDLVDEDEVAESVANILNGDEAK